MGKHGLMQPLGRLGSEEQSTHDLCCPNTKGVFSGECLEASDKVLDLLSADVFVPVQLPTVTASASNWQRLTWNRAHGILGDVVPKLLMEEWRMGWDGICGIDSRLSGRRSI